MSGKRRPMDVNLSVVEGGKGKHWTKAEVESRKNSEPNLPKPKALTPPDWLSDPAKKLFRKYAKQLLDFPSGIISKLDVGTLARYCDCELSYAEASKQKNVWMEIAHRKLEALCSSQSPEESDQDRKAVEDAYQEAEDQVNFWSSQMVKFEKIARSCATEMGMTISSRCKLIVPQTEKKQEDDPLAELQKMLLNG